MKAVVTHSPATARVHDCTATHELQNRPIREELRTDLRPTQNQDLIRKKYERWKQSETDIGFVHLQTSVLSPPAETKPPSVVRD